MIDVNWPTFQGLATVAGGIAGFVILAAAAASAIARLWRYRVVRLMFWPVTFTALAMRTATAIGSKELAEKFLRPIVRDEVGVLMKPNGGNSVADVSAKVQHLEGEITKIGARLDEHLTTSDDRAAEISRRLGALTSAIQGRRL